MLILIALLANAPGCVIANGVGGSTSGEDVGAGLADVIGAALHGASSCPEDVFQFRALLSSKAHSFETTMVANRGFHNPSEGSFSFFEIIRGNGLSEGEAFFGHFVVKDGGRLVAEQTPGKNALMIEAFAFDRAKSAFNFYELRGNGERGVWFYRGDSNDIAADVRALHISAPAEFGDRLRCSGCHVNGGAIMKELASPHNDWWTPERKLDFGGRVFEPRLQEILAGLQRPEKLAAATRASLAKLVRVSPALREAARPLFCPMEVNLESDTARLGPVTIPSAFFVDPRLASVPVKVRRAVYDAVVAKADQRFPETSAADADHAWLTPVKAWSDIAAIDELVAAGKLTEDFVLDVLSVDMTNPVFSRERCALLTSDWSKIPHKPPAERRADAKAYLKKCAEVDVGRAHALLMQRRRELAASDISKNPRGQILEPGFRVIFPESPRAPVPGELELDAECQVRAARR